MRTSTNLILISLLVSACQEASLPPSPYDDTDGFEQEEDPVNPDNMDSGVAGQDAGGEDAATPDASSDDAGGPDPERPEVPPLLPKTDCDPPRTLTDKYDLTAEVSLASNDKGSAALSWTSGEPKTQYASVYRQGEWQSERVITEGSEMSVVVGIDEPGGTYAFWWEEGLQGRKLETDDEAWRSAEVLDMGSDVPLRPLPYAVSPSGTSLFVRDSATLRSVVRFNSDLSLRDEHEIEPPSPAHQQEELLQLLTTSIGQAIVLTTWRRETERLLVPYFQDAGQLKPGTALTIADDLTSEQMAATVVPSGDLAVAAAEVTGSSGKIWVRRVTRSNGRWARDVELEKRDVANRRFALRTLLSDNLGLLRVAWIDGAEINLAIENEDGFSKPISVKLDHPETARFALDMDGNVSIVSSDDRGLTLRQVSARTAKVLPGVPITNHSPALSRIAHDADGNVILVWEEDGLRATVCREQTVGE